MKTLAIIVTIGLGICTAAAAHGQEFRPGLHQHAQGEATGSSSWGGLGFSMQVLANGWPELGRYLTPFVGNFRGGDPPRTGLGPITTGSAQPTSVKVLQNTWVGQTVRYTLADGQTMDLLASRMSPAILVRASAGKLHLLNLPEKPQRPKPASGKSTGAADAYLRYLAVSTNKGVKVLQGLAAVDGAELSEPWLMAWFGKSSPARSQDQDCPLLLVLQHRPMRVQLEERQGLNLRFNGDTGYVAVMALMGLAHVRASQSDGWATGLPEPMVRRARQWVPLLRHYPTDVKESYQVDHSGDRVTVREEVTFLNTEDDWKTKGRKIAPLPPVLAAAWRYRFPLRFSGEVVDVKHIEYAGPLAGIADVDQYTWEARGLLKYVREAIQVGDLGKKAAPLRRTLAAEVQKVLQAGHLRAGYFAGGLLDSGGAGAWDFWVNPGELVSTLSQASPLLDSDQMRSALRKYLAKEIAAYPPWKIGHIGYGQGHPRELYDLPPEELNGTVGRPTVSVRKHPEGPPTFDSMYAMWSYGQATGDWQLVRQGYGKMASLFRQHLRNYDWSILGVTAPMPMYPMPFGQKGGIHTCNTVLGGLIGYYRLAERFDRPEDRDLAAYLAVKQLVYRFTLARFQAVLQDSGAFVPVKDLSVRGDIFSRLSALPYEREQEVFPFMREVNKWEKEVLSFNRQFVLLSEVVPNKKYARISFLNLVPEVGRFLHDHALEDVRSYVRSQELIDPYWFVPRSVETRGESCPAPYSQNWDLFQAKALVLGEPAERLHLYLQCPIALGDLYYLQNLCATLRGYGQTRWVLAEP